MKIPGNIDLNKPDMDALSTWIVDLALLVYTTLEAKNDFVILHAVTSAWSLKQVTFQLQVHWGLGLLKCAKGWQQWSGNHGAHGLWCFPGCQSRKDGMDGVV